MFRTFLVKVLWLLSKIKTNIAIWRKILFLLVCRFAEEVSAPRSLPAKSIRENFPYKGNFLVDAFLKMIWNTACDLEECWLAEVCPEVLKLLPEVMSLRTSSTDSTTVSVSPTTCTWKIPDNWSKTFFNRQVDEVCSLIISSFKPE